MAVARQGLTATGEGANRKQEVRKNEKGMKNIKISKVAERTIRPLTRISKFALKNITKGSLRNSTLSRMERGNLQPFPLLRDGYWGYKIYLGQ